MPEIWIRPNRRVLLFGLVLPTLLLCAGLCSLVVGNAPGAHGMWYILGGILLALAGVAIYTIYQMISQPRLGYSAGYLLVYLEGSVPEKVPIDVVECFFRGQAEGLLRGADGRDAEVATVIVRLAESATQWHHRDVKPAFGMWCEGYITIRGTWCEPITTELMKQLNQRLVEAHRARKQQCVEAPI
jgi:hypothetical protein